MAGVAQFDIHLRFTWQAWHKLTSTVVLRGRRGTDGTGWRPWAGLGACDAAALCVAGVAQPDIHLRFTWQAWHKLTSTVVLRGRRGTDGTGWRAWAGLGACDAAALCVAGVAQPDIHLRFTWQAWHKLTSTVVLRGRRGTDGTGWRPWAGLGACDAAALCVAGVAQPDIHLRFTWQAWHKLTSTVVLRGRRGTDGTGWRAWAGLGACDACDAAALCVAGVAQPDIHLRFTWQAWHKLTSTVVLRGRRGTDHLSHTVTDHLSHTIFHTPTLSHAIFHTQLCHTPSFTRNFVTHQLCHTPSFTHQLCHTPSITHLFVTPHLSYTIFHTSHCHTPSFTNPLSHTTLSHTIFDTPLCHTPLCHTSHCHIPSFTHHFVTRHLSHTVTDHLFTSSFTHHLPHTTLSHTIFHHTIFHTQLCRTPSFTTPSLTQLCHTPSFAKPSFTHQFVTHHLSHNFVTRPLSHTTFAHTILHTPLCHTHYLS